MFHNEGDEPSRYVSKAMARAALTMFTDKQMRPFHPLPITNPREEDIGCNSITWLGHSFILVRTGSVTVMIDPVLNNHSFPFCFTPYYYYDQEQVIPDVQVDVILVSHNHYDHLDPKLIGKLAPKLILMPTGDKAYLREEDKAKGVELGLNQSYSYKDCVFTLVPSRHFSNRLLNDRDKTLWGGFVLVWSGHSIYYSGDTGYSEHNTDCIRRMFPAGFDVLLLECGQYGEGWPDTHLFPADFIKYASRIQAKHTIPVHYGKFHLNAKRWCAGVQDVYRNRDQLQGTTLKIMKIGETISLDNISPAESDLWWQGL